MYKNKKILALITARGGSKGIPGKNIKKFCAKPMVYWTIKEALKCKYIDELVVSTDSKKIAAICEKYGAGAPFLRPGKFSKDNSNSIEVAMHAVDFLKAKGKSFDILLLLQPTSPLRVVEDMNKSLELLFRKNAKAVISVTEAFTTPLWMNTLPKNGSMKDFLPKMLINKSRQSLKPYYQLNGAIFLGFIDYVRKNNTFFGSKTYAYIMPKARSVDIDDILDFKFAQTLKR
jgi:N-acylneuraminate cytidylyltransferase/CMP-N,N'-diacetyllegionaminic acid synthase